MNQGLQLTNSTYTGEAPFLAGWLAALHIPVFICVKHTYRIYLQEKQPLDDTYKAGKAAHAPSLINPV